MKTIGLIGGMSWESSTEYYRIINEEVNKKLGGLHSAKCVLYSVDFEEIERCQSEGNWGKSGQILGEAAQSLENAGADYILICTNTMHKVVEIIEKEISIPVIHIADATARQIKKLNLKKVGLLGTKYTMEEDFLQLRIESNGIKVLVPDNGEHIKINQVIFEELCLGRMNPDSREYFIKVMKGLIEQGAEGIILGCTEIGLLVKNGDVDVPLFDSALIHAMESVEYALG
ncbi:aspartate/glutamate racemase family protein [Bacillus massilinigeriensis]|uniref:aspartate/glutamate racemase family protein n=1 Tax=Bacillus massilionigeriensis TaxID=1805475 RepID=UPI00096B29EE|nr:aspartate/glutamate racemase family protein [Bacillus massilionigeriensis]